MTKGVIAKVGNWHWIPFEYLWVGKFPFIVWYPLFITVPLDDADGDDTVLAFTGDINKKVTARRYLAKCFDFLY